MQHTIKYPTQKQFLILVKKAKRVFVHSRGLGAIRVSKKVVTEKSYYDWGVNSLSDKLKIELSFFDSGLLFIAGI